MKRDLHLAIAAMMAVALPSNAWALNTAAPLLCSVSMAHQCDAGAPCSQVTPEVLNLPDFLLIDHQVKQVRMLGSSAADRVTAIKHSEVVKGNLILQGAESSEESDREAVGWTVAIDDESGQMVATATDGGSAIVAFGKCIEQPK